jgi:hypothetical protein
VLSLKTHEFVQDQYVQHKVRRIFADQNAPYSRNNIQRCLCKSVYGEPVGLRPHLACTPSVHLCSMYVKPAGVVWRLLPLDGQRHLSLVSKSWATRFLHTQSDFEKDWLLCRRARYTVQTDPPAASRPLIQRRYLPSQHSRYGYM